jgi:hypothetical protein
MSKTTRYPSQGNNKSINLRTIRAGTQSRTRTPNPPSTTLRTPTPFILITKTQETTMKSNTIVAKTKSKTPGSRTTPRPTVLLKITLSKALPLRLARLFKWLVKRSALNSLLNQMAKRLHS